MTSRDDRIQDRARRIAAEESTPAALSPEEAETVAANKALKAAANGASRDTDALAPDLDAIPPAD
jgi:hypothetical protein